MRRSAMVLALLASAFAASVVIAAEPAVERVERGNLVLENIPEIPERITERMRQYENIRSASMQGWLPGGQGLLISTRFAETSQVHRVDRPGGARRQITFWDEPVRGATPSPDSKTNGFLFIKDVGGSEFYQIWFHDLGTGRATMLTDGTSRNGNAVWANDGRRFVHYTTRRNGRDWDLHVVDVGRPGQSTPVLEKEGAWIPADWSPDDTKIAVARYVSANEVHPYILDLKSKALMPIAPQGEKAAFGAMRFSRDGKGLYYTTDLDSEFERLHYRDFATGNDSVLTQSIPWDVEEIALSRDGRRLAFTVNEDGISRLHVRDTATGAEQRRPAISEGHVGGLEFDPSGDRLALTLNTSRTPGDVHVVDLKTSSIEQWTHSEVGGLDTGTFVTPTLIRYNTFDTMDGTPREIPAFYYAPKGEGPFPVVVSIHGGPEGQARPNFSSTIQYWANELGIAVIRPNVRGSSGYGKSFLQLDNGFKREDSVKDIGSLLDWIAARPELDANRVGVYGGSYGGYMVLASMTHFNDRLRAGVDIVGISNFATFLTNTNDYRRDLRRVEYGDEQDAEMRAFLERISPTTNAHKISKPLFVAQGLNDPRVPVTESEQMVEIIRRQGGAVWYLLAKDEGHGFSKKSNKDFYEAAVSLFLERYLVGEPSAADMDR